MLTSISRFFKSAPKPAARTFLFRRFCVVSHAVDSHSKVSNEEHAVDYQLLNETSPHEVHENLLLTKKNINKDTVATVDICLTIDIVVV